MKYISRKIIKFIKNPLLLIGVLGANGLLNFIPDEIYLKWLFKARLGHTLNLDAPQTFNEKIQWLKIHDRKPVYTIMVNKYAAKKYVADIIGDEYIIPTLGCYNSFDEIDFDKLPNQFVLKCTHDSGGLYICRNKDELNKKAAKKKLNKSLKKNFYLGGREWPYKNVPRKIIAEKYMEQKDKTVSEELDARLGEMTDIVCGGGI